VRAIVARIAAIRPTLRKIDYARPYPAVARRRRALKLYGKL
jgi:hypothetical protein